MLTPVILRTSFLAPYAMPLLNTGFAENLKREIRSIATGVTYCQPVDHMKKYVFISVKTIGE